jgi:hypothetical protein
MLGREPPKKHAVACPRPGSEAEMQTLRVICKRKHALHERIESIKCVDTTTGTEQQLSEDEAIRLIESGTARLVVRDDRGHQAAVEVEQREGRKFLITKPDDVRSDNLLALPECEARKIPTPPPYRPVTPARPHCAQAPWKKSA